MDTSRTRIERVLVVARTRMGRARCIGALGMDGGRSYRLLPRDRGWRGWPEGICPFRVGRLYTVELSVPSPGELEPPHVEDVRVQRILEDRGAVGNLAEIVRRTGLVVRGGVSSLFDGCLRFTESGSGYVASSTGVPRRSTMFWVPDRDLVLKPDEHGHPYFHVVNRAWNTPRRLKYVGDTASVPRRIPAGTLLRVSLARWWAGRNGQGEPRCYLQLSGWLEEVSAARESWSTATGDVAGLDEIPF